MRQFLFRLLRIAAIAYVVYLGVMSVIQERLIFVGWKLRHVDATVPRPADAEQLWVTTASGERVEGWFLPGNGVSAANPGPLVIFAHGNAELIDDLPREAQPYRDLGVSVLFPEYRGFGRSGGAPGASNCVADYVAFRDLAAKRADIDVSRIFYHGRSIGGGIVAQLAMQRAPAAMILESTFTSLDAMAWRYACPPFLNRNRLQTELALPKIAAPILIFHGIEDRVVPVWHARRLAEIARDAKLIEMHGGHAGFPPDPKPYWDAIREFLKQNKMIN